MSRKESIVIEVTKLFNYTISWTAKKFSQYDDEY